MRKSFCFGNGVLDVKLYVNKKINIRKKDSFFCKGGKIIVW